MTDARQPQDRGRHPLNDFGDRWVLDGDLLRCQGCKRGQHTSWMRIDFAHAAGCKLEGKAELTPWLTLVSLINAELPKARVPDSKKLLDAKEEASG